MFVLRFAFFFTLSFCWKNGRSFRRISRILRLILLVIFLKWIFCSWKYVDCPGFSDCYICRPFSYQSFLNEPSAKKSFSRRDDYRRLMNITNFTFVISPRPCGNASLLIMVHSATFNFHKRQVVRSTWGSVVDDRYKLLFLLGATTNDSLQDQLKKESDLYGDVVQGNFIDVYRNLTYKHVMGLKWKEYFCPKVDYVLKTDDDVFVNVQSLLTYLSVAVAVGPESNAILCIPEERALAKRSSRSKWKVTRCEYPFRSYPTFCQGFVVLYPSKTVSKLYSVAQDAKWFWIDDVFVTGILAAAVGVNHFSLTRSAMTYNDMNEILLGNQSIYKYLVGPSNLDTAAIQKLWNITKYGE